MNMCSSHASRLLLLLTSFLAFSVIFWGLHDKLALYRSTADGIPVAKAKLLSGRELASDTANASAPETPAEPNLIAAVYFTVACAMLLASCFRESATSATPFPTTELPEFVNALYRRPPPRELLSRV